jgi:hypothetical protein
MPTRTPALRHRAADPAGRDGLRVGARAAAEGDDGLHAELRGKLHGLLEDAVVGLRRRRVRVQRIAVAAEGADDEVAPVDGLLERLQALVARQQRGGVRVGVPRVGPRPDLDRSEAEVDDIVQRFFERLLPEQDGEHPDLHAAPFTRTQRRVCDERSTASSTR